MINDIASILESGNLPGWFPKKIREDALLRRRNLLRRHGMTLDSLREAIEEIIEAHREHFTDPNYAIHEHRSMTFRDGKYDIADPERAILARYLYAATLDEKNGLALLIGTDHAGRVEKGDNYSAHQAVIGSNLKGKVGDRESGNALNSILIKLASEKDELGNFIPAPNLWEPLFSELEDAGAEPNIVRNNREPRKSHYDYKVHGKPNHNGDEASVKLKSITLGRFETRIGECRKKLSRKPG